MKKIPGIYIAHTENPAVRDKRTEITNIAYVNIKDGPKMSRNMLGGGLVSAWNIYHRQRAT